MDLEIHCLAAVIQVVGRSTLSIVSEDILSLKRGIKYVFQSLKF